MSTRCTLCPRRCGVNRPASRRAIGAGERVGVCGMGRNPVVARAALHRWEEPCISGTRGSGTVFFSGCPLRCVFCQNRAISRDGFGKELTPAALRRVFDRLIEAGAHNINLVTPTHFVDGILEAIGEGLSVPVVYNTGGYESLETLRRFEGAVSVYLPDMKYALAEPARRYSGAADYPEVAAAAIREMFRQTGPFQLDADGMLVRGVLIRHLMLPGQLENTRRVIDFVADTFPKGSVLFSLMSQYTPVDLPDGYPELARRLTTREYTRAQEYMTERGVEDGFVQERSSSAERFIPEFDLTGLEGIE
ncbi:MAG: radical SAM protein [Clostridia bacterium]|nr:radical SAM protein [Clostridia bacterium]